MCLVKSVTPETPETPETLENKKCEFQTGYGTYNPLRKRDTRDLRPKTDYFPVIKNLYMVKIYGQNVEVVKSNHNYINITKKQNQKPVEITNVRVWSG